MGKREELVPARRFETATDPAARARLDNFRDGVKKFQKNHAEILGATVYGSMIKGEKATDKSDVDGFLYIDGEAIAEKLKDARSLEVEYRDNFLKELKVSDADAATFYRDLRPKLLSPAILEREIFTYIEDNNTYKAHQQMIRDSYLTSMREEERDKLYDQSPKPSMISFELGGIFHGRVGSGIEKYRRIFLEKIMALPREEADEIWRSVYIQLTTMEGRWSEGKRVKFPETLEEALRIYHPELLRNIGLTKDQNKIADLRSAVEGKYPK